MDNVYSQAKAHSWNLSAAQGSITRVVGDMDKCGCFQADDGVEGLIHSPGVRRTLAGALGLREGGRLCEPSALPPLACSLSHDHS